MRGIEVWEGALAAALRLADIADEISMRWFHAPNHRAERKADRSIVTAADLEIERALRDEIAAEFPHDAVLGEEFGLSGEGARLWTVDPIDGTNSFAERGTDWATLIALVDEDSPVVGVVSRPSIGRRWWAAQGLGAFADGRPIQVSRTLDLSDAVLAEDFRISIGRNLEDNPLPLLARRCARVYPWHERGDMLRIAEGHVDCCLHWWSGTGPDLYSSVCILTEAGGKHTDLAGVSDVEAQVRVMTNGLLQEDVLRFVNELIDDGSFDPSVKPVEDIAAIMRARDQQPPMPPTVRH
jgi:histidinol-phosphatase